MSLKNENIKYIICTIDDNYVQHFLVMLVSLFFNNSNSQFKVFILTEGLENNNKKIIKTFFEIHKQSYEILIVNPLLLKEAPVFGHVSLATYYRILIPLLIPKYVTKALFIDSDIIVRGNIDLFWEADISSYSHLAVENEGKDKEFKSNLGMNDDSLYFNAGVMMININWWRLNKVYEKSIDFIVKYPEKITYWDQDVLNAVLSEKWVSIPSEYNAQRSNFYNNNLKLDQINTKNNPVIVHFTGSGSCKPWYYANNHKFKYEYEKYLRMTSFKNTLPIGHPKEKKLLIRDKFYLFRKRIIDIKFK